MLYVSSDILQKHDHELHYFFTVAWLKFEIDSKRTSPVRSFDIEHYNQLTFGEVLICCSQFVPPVNGSKSFANPQANVLTVNQEENEQLYDIITIMDR